MVVNLAMGWRKTRKKKSKPVNATFDHGTKEKNNANSKCKK